MVLGDDDGMQASQFLRMDTLSYLQMLSTSVTYMKDIWSARGVKSERLELKVAIGDRNPEGKEGEWAMPISW